MVKALHSFELSGTNYTGIQSHNTEESDSIMTNYLRWKRSQLWNAMYINIIYTVLQSLSSRKSVIYLDRFGLVQNGARYISKDTSTAHKWAWAQSSNGYPPSICCLVTKWEYPYTCLHTKWQLHTSSTSWTIISMGNINSGFNFISDNEDNLNKTLNIDKALLYLVMPVNRMHVYDQQRIQTWCKK